MFEDIGLNRVLVEKCVRDDQHHLAHCRRDSRKVGDVLLATIIILLQVITSTARLCSFFKDVPPTQNPSI